MRYKLGFTQADDGKLLVLTETLGANSACIPGGFAITRFNDENVFLYYTVLADLDEEVTTALISNVLLLVSGMTLRSEWVVADVSQKQLQAMGLSRSTIAQEVYAEDASQIPDVADLHDVLMQTPTPVRMLVGPEHRVAFINTAYVRIMGRTSAESMLGKTVREVMPELQGQPFFTLLDKVYRTGESFVGTEVPAQIKNELTGKISEHYFDFVHHPVRNKHGEVYGILSQTNDVTERVLSRQVNEAREEQLYRQWAELEAIYKTSPVGMALIDVHGYRILRINEMNAQVLGMPIDDAVGKAVFDLYPDMDDLRRIYERVKSGEEVRNIQIDLPEDATTTKVRHWLLNFSPVRNPLGGVDAIASIAVPLADGEYPKQRILFDPSVSLVTEQ